MLSDPDHVTEVARSLLATASLLLASRGRSHVLLGRRLVRQAARLLELEQEVGCPREGAS